MDIYERLAEVGFDDRSELESLTRVVSIDRVDGNDVWAYAWPADLRRLRELGYSWQELPIPGSTSKARMSLLARAASGRRLGPPPSGLQDGLPLVGSGRP